MDNKEEIRFELSMKELDGLGARVVKNAFRSLRQILILTLYAVAILFVINDFSFSIQKVEESAVEKLPWLVLYVLAHYFCRDYGIQKGREDEDFLAVDRVYRGLCNGIRERRREFEDYCRYLERYYGDARRRRLLEELGIYGEPPVAPDRRAARALRRIERLRPIRITYGMIVATHGEKIKDGSPLKRDFGKYMRYRSWVSVAKIIFLSLFTFSLTASLGGDPRSSLLEGAPYLATMLSVSITAALGAYRSVLSYDVDCINDRISLIRRFESGEWTSEQGGGYCAAEAEN